MLPLLLAPVTASAATVEVWEKVAACESSNNWTINTGNGYYGGLQFAPTTWAEFGGHLYAPNAHQATKEQQIAIAEKVLASQGTGAWPHCSVVAGLTRNSEPAEGTSDEVADVGDAVQEDVRNDSEGATTAVQDKAKATTAVQPKAKATTAVQAKASESRQASAPVYGAVITTSYRQAGAWAAGYHTGVDFAVPTGTPVQAVSGGTVVSSGWAGAYGNSIVIRHTDGMYTLYAHLASTTVTAGETVDSGQRIGLSGSTGNSTGPHLHFEARTENSYHAHTDPVAYLRGLGVSL
ncbi:transglycosylase family protein [Streptomyces sp. NPDC015127]|uniref:transglycosylase family protein n=1 Tax=Streptomyces sp. NPDC015127 TaxID=3364939 RepID=UPI0036FE31F2